MSSARGNRGITTTEETTDTRRRILRTTLRLIADDGIHAISNRRVAAESGVALGSLTYHFPSQTELLRESLLLHVSEEVERLQAIAESLSAPNPVSPARVAQEVEDEFRRSLDSHGGLAEIELHVNAARDPELRDVSDRIFAAYENFGAASLRALGIPEPERHAVALVAVMTGFGLRGRASGEHDFTGTADALLTIIKGATMRTPRPGREDS